MRRVLALAGAALAAAAAAVSLLLALDIRRYDHRIAADDQAVAASPARSDLWRPNQVVPFGAAKGLLGLGDDIAYRRALRLFLLGKPWSQEQFVPVQVVAYRNAAAIELARLVQHDPDAARRSRELNMLGAISTTAISPLERVHRLSAIVRATLSYRDAVHADDGNDNAKFNLEVALRLLGTQPVSLNSLRGLGGEATESTHFGVGY
jgi:hypothetical protein